MGTGRGLGVVLHAHDRAVGHSEACNGVIVEMDVGFFATSGLETLQVHGEAVVLAGNFNVAGACIQDGLIAAAVAELELIGLRADREREQLMTEADAEGGNSFLWHLTDDLSKSLHGRIDRGGITWPI